MSLEKKKNAFQVNPNETLILEAPTSFHGDSLRKLYAPGVLQFLIGLYISLLKL